jgi:adenylate cyclase
MFGRNFVWRRGQQIAVTAAPYGADTADDYRTSPLYTLYHTGTEVRRRLIDLEDLGNSPFLADMRGEGVTDYIAIPLYMSDGEIHASSWTTCEPGGFTDAQIEALRELNPSLTRMIEIFLLRRTAAGLLDNYVGAGAGARIRFRRRGTPSLRRASAASFR